MSGTSAQWIENPGAANKSSQKRSLERESGLRKMESQTEVGKHFLWRKDVGRDDDPRKE